jgi:hypothetical protein
MFVWAVVTQVLVMLVFGGMAKGELMRIKVRARETMADLTEREGRFLGSRPPYGYRLTDVGPHPNPEKAKDGVQLHGLEVDGPPPRLSNAPSPSTSGRGWRAIAQGLTDGHVPSPAEYDRARNGHGLGRGWAHTAVRAVVDNPRYTGRQVWGRQPRHEKLLDPTAPQDGYTTVQRWADPSKWQRSVEGVHFHEAIVDDSTFERAQTLRHLKGHDRARSLRPPKAHSAYLLAGRVGCGVCGRRMSRHRSGQRLGYRCRLRDDYALRVGDEHPLSVWVPERKLVVATFEWLDEIFSDDNRGKVLAEISTSGDVSNTSVASVVDDLKDIERRIERLVDAVENGKLTVDEVDERLRRLRERRDLAPVPAGRATPRDVLDPAAVAQVLDELGGLSRPGGGTHR